MQTYAQKPSSRGLPASQRAGATSSRQAPALRPDTEPVTHGAPAAFDLSRVSLHPRAGAILQAKLTVASPGDSFEQEADRIASRIDRVDAAASPFILARATPAVQRQCACGGTCDHCQAEKEDQEHGHLQRKPSGAAPLQAAPSIVHNVLRSGGQPLAAATRAFFEPRLGYDFSSVRIHSGAVESASAAAVHARAYTVGHNVVFAAGEFAPASASGRALLAHELTHVVQQGAATHRSGTAHSPTSLSIPAPGRAPQAIQRACDPKAISASTGCTSSDAPTREPSSGNPFVLHFDFACDTFKPGEETRLRLIAYALAASSRLAPMRLRLDGFASDEGDGKFNEALSCARARKVQAILAQAGLRGADVKVVSHGGTGGDRPAHRSVVLTGASVQAAATPVPVPQPVPKPPEPRQKDDPIEDNSDLWPKWRKQDPWWKRIIKRIRDLTDLIRRGVDTGIDVLDELNNVRQEILSRLNPLLLLLLVGSLDELPQIMVEIGALRGLLSLLDKLSTSVPSAPYNDFPPGAGPGSRYDPPPDWKPDAPRTPQDQPKEKPEKKPEPQKKKPDEKKNTPPKCSPTLYLPFGKLPHFGLYQVEAARHRLRGYPTEIRDKQRTTAYERESHQVKRWKDGMKSAAGMKPGVMSGGKQMLMADGKCNTDAECEKLVLVPDWGRNGEPQTMNVDHIRELQLSFDLPLDDFDQFSNYELLDEATNKSSGATLDHALQAERNRLNAECPQEFDWQHVGLIFDPPVLLGGGRGPGVRWTRQEIIAGKHLNAYRPKPSKKKKKNP